MAQAIKTRLLLLYSEWWEDREDGLPLWEQILSAPASEDSLTAVDLLFKERIENTTGVLSLLGYESSFDREMRKYTFTAAVETMYGELIVSNTGVSE